MSYESWKTEVLMERSICFPFNSVIAAVIISVWPIRADKKTVFVMQTIFL